MYLEGELTNLYKHRRDAPGQVFNTVSIIYEEFEVQQVFFSKLKYLGQSIICIKK